MPTRNPIIVMQSPREAAARKRLKEASRALADAVAEQNAQVRELRDNLNALDGSLARLADTMERSSG